MTDATPILEGVRGGVTLRAVAPALAAVSNTVLVSGKSMAEHVEPGWETARRASSRVQTVRVTLMRGFDLTVDGGHVPLPPRAQRMIAFLALHDRPVPRGFVGQTLYTNSPEARLSGNLRTALWRMRRSGCDLVEARGECLAVSDRASVDVRRLACTAHRLLRDGAQPDASEVDDLAAGGELLPGWYEDWVVMERERTRQLWLRTLEVASERLTGAGRHEDALVAGLAAVESEPLRESAHRAVILAHLAAGNRGEAIRQYRRCATILARELGLTPSPETRALTGALG